MVYLNLFVLQLFKFNHVPLSISVSFDKVLDRFLLLSSHFNELALVLLIDIWDERAYRQAIRIFGSLPFLVCIVIRLLALWVSISVVAIPILKLTIWDTLIIFLLSNRQEFWASWWHFVNIIGRVNLNICLLYNKTHRYY